jgi:hypothetical protein
MATAFHQVSPSANISRLLTAAVVNQGFCKLLLSNPEQAISRGYNGEAFRLDRHEQELVLSIHATSLADFAGKVTNEHTSKIKHPAKGHKSSYLL